LAEAAPVMDQSLKRVAEAEQAKGQSQNLSAEVAPVTGQLQQKLRYCFQQQH